MSANEAIQTKNLSTEVVVNIFRDGFRASRVITDPNATDRPDDGEFILTSYPSTDVFFPLIVVEEFDDASDRIDSQGDLHQHEYSVQISIYAYSNTNLYKIRDEIRHFLEQEYKNFMSDGFAEPTIESSTAANWESDPKVQKWEMVVSGLVHTYV